MNPEANDWVLGIFILLLVFVLGGGISDIFNWMEKWPRWLKLTFYYIRWPIFTVLVIYSIWDMTK